MAKFGWFAYIAAMTLSSVLPWNACTVLAHARSMWQNCESSGARSSNQRRRCHITRQGCSARGFPR